MSEHHPSGQEGVITANVTVRSEQSLEFPCGEAPQPGHVRELAAGVLWIRMPMPFALNHINLWAIRDRRSDGSPGWMIADTGLQTLETATAWRQILGDQGPLGGQPVTRVVVTHMHPDHVGMAGWLTRKYGCALWMTRVEYLNCRVLAADTGRAAPEDGIRFYRKAGWSDDDIENYRARFGGFGKMIHQLPDSYRRIQDGDTMLVGEHEWRVVVGTGHSPEHACLYCPALKVLIAGDQVLPNISSNVSVFPTEPGADSLGDWLDSIGKIKGMVPDDVLVLPAHNEPFRGLHARLDRLASGHLKALDRLRSELAQPKRAIDVFGALFARPIVGNHQLLSLATGESIAHINYLLRRGEAAVTTDDHGVAWYRLK